MKDMILLSNTARRTIVGLDGYGLSVTDVRPIPPMEADR